ncbi:MAG TPA: WYL domain-containing protein [Propionicimonas sp.]|nr:WYL domain-containing protein [Propionicimonas sp.]HQA77514.1 WYL domain-containing protein [Propionicimonas sp.]HQD96103.1 WYL domain-containing protein [Propionicimonas sp.]
MTSADQVSRLLSLVPYLQTHPDAELSATAELFAVSTEQLLADLHVLWYCGLPGGMPGDLIEIDMETVADTGRIRLSNAEYLSRPLRFTPDEALSLVVALRAVRELVGRDAAGDVDTALVKLEAAAGAGVGAPVPRVAVSGGDEDLRQRLAEAIASGVVTELEYTDSGLVTSSPLVAPAQLIVRDGFGYLQAWSLDREAWRTYRLDRITAVRETTRKAPEHGTPPDFGAGWLDERPDAAEVTLRLTPSAEWITEYYPVRAVRHPRGAVEVDLLVADPAWLRSLLLRLGREVRRVSPPEAADGARAAAADALIAYAAG